MVNSPTAAPMSTPRTTARKTKSFMAVMDEVRRIL